VSTGWVTVGALVIFVLFTALVLPQQAERAEQTTGSGASPDTSFTYSVEDLYRTAELYGEEGRVAYVRARLTFDAVWPLVYAFFLTTALSWTSRRAFALDSPWQRSNLGPILVVLLDYLENLSTSIVMLRYPARTPGIDALAPVFTTLKWVALGLSFSLLAAGSALAVWRWARRRTRRK
jgi:hypothetical protein